MASRPKRRKTSRVQLPNPSTTASSSTTPAMPQNIDTESMIQSCMAQILPNIENTFRQYMENFHTQQRKTANPSTESIDVNRPPPTIAAQATACDGTNPDLPRSQQSSQTLLEEITSTDNRVPSSFPSHAVQTYAGSFDACQTLKVTQDDLVRNSLSQSTLSAYKSAFVTYRDFINMHFGSGVNPLPPSPKHLSAFIANYFLRKLAASSTRTLVSSLRFIFQLGGFQDITQHFIIKKMLIWFQKCKPSLDSRLPITPAILIQLVNALLHTSSSAFLRCLLRAMFILAFCAFLRVGEITKTTGSAQHFLRFEHISIHRGVDHLQLIDINIPYFKHSKTNVTTLRLHQNTKNPVICPCLALTQYLQLRKHGSPSEPLFSFMDKLPVSKQFFTHHLRTALAFCNLDLQRYQSHSFRIGAATTAASLGFSEIQIQVWVDGVQMH